MAYAGIPMPELLIQEIAESVVEDLGQDAMLVDLVMANASAADRDSVKTALQHVRPGKVRLGYPLEEPADWQVSIVLHGTTQPSRVTIGQTVGAIDKDELAVASLNAGLTDAVDVTLPLAAVPPGLPAIGLVHLGDDEVAIYVLGPGPSVVLKQRGVLGTLADVHGPGTDAVFFQAQTRAGWEETMPIRLDVMSTNSVLNIALATIIKAALVQRQSLFEAAGLTLETVLEAEPKPGELVPWLVLTRSLILRVTRWFTVPEVLPTAATDVAMDPTAATTSTVAAQGTTGAFQ